MRKYRLETYYNENDVKFMRDYLSVSLFDEQGNEVAHFGDYYHDKGDEKMEGFIEGMEYAFDECVEIERVNVNKEVY